MLILTVCVWYAIVYESQLLRSYENARLKITVESIIGLPTFLFNVNIVKSLQAFTAMFYTVRYCKMILEKHSERCLSVGMVDNHYNVIETKLAES